MAGLQTWRNLPDAENLFALEDVGSMASYAVQSQYAASKTIRALAAQAQENLDASRDVDLFYDSVANFETCSGVSLDVWAQRVGLEDRAYVDEDGNVVEWTEDDYRLLVKYKALSNISAGDSATINRLMTEFFQNYTFCIDGQNMTVRIVFLWYLSDLEANLIRNHGLFVRGAGVGYTFYQIDPEHTFGFDGSGLQPFNQAPFLAKALGTI